MQNVTYSLRDQREKNEAASLFQQLQLTLDSLGNNLIAMLWLAELALTALREEDNLDQAKKNLHDALQAGECAKKLMRTVLNSQKINHIDSQWLQARLI
jgi:hypothetical protein